ncbi:MAG: hypothetical protein ACXWCZ_00640 [Flavisolibacter sp.]
MVEVFKTNVKERLVAFMLVDAIHKEFVYYKANFDLDDRDRILRVVSSDGPVQNNQLIEIIIRNGFHAEVLADDLPIVQNVLNPSKIITDEYK